MSGKREVARAGGAWGAFRADVIAYRRYGAMKNLLLFLAVSVVAGLGDAMAIMLTFPVMMAMGALLSLAYIDETSGWARLRLTMPVSRVDVIRGRYASVLAVTAGSILLGAVVALAVSTVVATVAPDARTSVPDLATLGLGVLTGAGFAVLVVALDVPLVARFGVTGGVRAVTAVFVALAMIVIIVGRQGGLDGVIALVSSWGAWAAGPFAALVVAVLAASYALATRLYAGREF